MIELQVKDEGDNFGNTLSSDKVCASAGGQAFGRSGYAIVLPEGVILGEAIPDACIDADYKTSGDSSLRMTVNSSGEDYPPFRQTVYPPTYVRQRNNITCLFLHIVKS
jgi:hypothetical protein